jgi:hypothetical protein
MLRRITARREEAMPSEPFAVLLASSVAGRGCLFVVVVSAPFFVIPAKALGHAHM